MSQDAITKQEIDGLISEAIPTFRESAQYDRDEFSDLDGILLPYVMVGGLVRHLVDLRLANETASIDAAFEFVESMIRNGDSYVQELAIVGILEDLQNSNLHHDGSRPSDFEPYLRPWSKWYWDEVDLFWSGSIEMIGTSGRPRPAGMPDPTASQ